MILYLLRIVFSKHKMMLKFLIKTQINREKIDSKEYCKKTENLSRDKNKKILKITQINK